MENLLELIYEHYTENNPVEKNTDAGKAAKAKEKERLRIPDCGEAGHYKGNRCQAHLHFSYI